MLMLARILNRYKKIRTHRISILSAVFSKSFHSNWLVNYLISYARKLRQSGFRNTTFSLFLFFTILNNVITVNDKLVNRYALYK